ncbi:MAG: hypothetical protein LUC88_03900 [Prevotella sp.]|nr:hypothetical protein [Prevotella sp.]
MSYIVTISDIKNIVGIQYDSDGTLMLQYIATANVSGDATGIKGMTLQRVAGDNRIYTISGQLVNAATKKGIYIVNGKKVLIK